MDAGAVWSFRFLLMPIFPIRELYLREGFLFAFVLAPRSQLT